MADHIYYSFQINNDQNSTIYADKTDTRLSPLIKNPSEYGVSILKFSLPTEALKSFIVNNSNDYKITIGSSASLAVINTPTDFINFKASNSLPLSSSYNYITYEDVIEAFNRTSMMTYRDYLNSMSGSYLSFFNRLNFAETFNFNVTGPSYVYEKTFAVNSDILTSVDNRLGYIRLTLNVGFTGSESSEYVGSKHPHRLYLISPDGVKCLIYSGFDTNYSNQLVFEDSSLTSTESLSDFTLQLPSGSYQPKESFMKFNTNTSQFGNWKLRFESLDCNIMGNHDFHLNVAYNMDMWFLPKQYNGNDLGISQFPPLLGFAEGSTTLLQLKLHESWFYGNNYLAFSPKLNNILGFQSYLASDGNYRVKLPQVLLSSTMTSNSFINYVQPISTLYKLTNIKAIQLRSNSLPVSGEYSIASGSNIVMSINVSVDTNKDVYEFTSTIERFYDLIGDTELTDINFSVWVEYNDGSVVKAQLPPYSQFSMLAKFVIKHKITN